MTCDSNSLGIRNDCRRNIPSSSPVWELKPTSRGGETGGARVYLFLLEDDGAGIVNCEIKLGNAPDMETLRVVLEVLEAYQQGVPVFEEPHT